MFHHVGGNIQKQKKTNYLASCQNMAKNRDVINNKIYGITKNIKLTNN